VRKYLCNSLGNKLSQNVGNGFSECRVESWNLAMQKSVS
jgi:hypothetical protein